MRKPGDRDCLDQRHGPIIGAMEELAYRESATTLSAGDSLLIFTDGVTEAMDVDGGLYSESRLEQMLDTGSFGTTAALVDETLASVESFATGAEQADDITILAFRLEQEPVQLRQLSMVIEPDFQEIERVNCSLSRFAEENGIPNGVSAKVCIAIDDLVNNIIAYGLDEKVKHSIGIEFRYSEKQLIIEIIDGGMPFNPFESLNADTTSSVEEREIGGLGRLLVKELMDDVSYQRLKEKNVVRLLMNMPA
jgi:sigma-B regulation protein RsbU (phosphoserine phosphatase)